MKRRDFITLLGGAAAAMSPMAAHAQQATMPVVGFLGGGSPAPFMDAAFRDGLKETGYIDGLNVRIEHRWAGGDYKRLPVLAAELVDLRVTVITTNGTPAAHATKIASTKVTPAIPVVFALGSDPVEEGLVASLNRPGGNITGIASISGALDPKKLELVREFLAEKAVALLINPANPLSQSQRRDFEAAAQAIRQRLEIVTAGNQEEIEHAFATLKQRQVGALIVAVDTLFFNHLQRMATLASRVGIPAIGPLREFAVEGGLMSYGTNIGETNRQAGIYVGRILKGERPADLPVLQPTKFELVLNLKAAKALAIEISPKLLALADEVIE